MARILVIAERVKGQVDDSAWELLTAARALAGEGGKVAAALLGEGVGELAAQLAQGFDEVYVFDDSRLAVPDGEADGAALRGLGAAGHGLHRHDARRRRHGPHPSPGHRRRR